MLYTNKYNFGTNLNVWNPWKGCFQISEACQHCYISELNSFSYAYSHLPPSFTQLPIGTVIIVALRSDFFLKEADIYRETVWNTIRGYPNLIFKIITKRVERIKECLPKDWGDGWENVIIAATVENQKRVSERLPIFLNLPLKHRWLACTPLLEEIDLTPYLSTNKIEHVEVNGEKSYKQEQIRPLKISWVKNLRQQCVSNDVRLSFLFVGSHCILEDDSIISDNCMCYHSEVADSLNISYYKPISFKLKDKEIVY